MTELNNVVSRLCSDGSVWPVDPSRTLGELVNLVHYKIRTEGDMANKHKTPLNTTSVTTAVVDLGKQLLLYAKDSDLTGVQTMLARGAPFTSDWLGMSALHFASMNNQYEICDVLIKGGMNKDIKTKVDRTPLHFAAYYGHERIVEMLLSRKCSVNPKDMLRMTPLHWAIERRHKNIARLLLKYNADVNVVTKFNKTPIGIAVLTEQADILAELQTAKAEQAKKKFNEEQEKEISSAVGTILAENAADKTQATNANDYMEVEVVGSENISNLKLKPPIKQIQKSTGNIAMSDKNAINLLKSHGIAIMQDEDEDASKELLSTALRNGRQLVLSEGGKLLLNETRTQQQHQQQRTNENKNHNNTLNNDKDVSAFSVPELTTAKHKTPDQLNADHHQRNNVRIVSYKEFQHMFYNNADGKPVEKQTMPSMSNMRIIRQHSDTAAINLSSSTTARSNQQVLNQQQQQHRQLKITPMKTATTSTPTPTNSIKSNVNSALIKNDGKDLSDFIEILPRNVDEDYCIEESSNDINEVVIKQNNAEHHTISNGSQNNKTPPVCFIPAAASTASAATAAATSKNDNAIPTSTTTTTTVTQNITTTSTIRQITTAIKRPHSQITSTHHHQQQQQNHNNQAKMPATNANIKPTPNVMPLLSTPDICRELYEMRKQNEELLRRVDSLEKEKEDMRQRLDRLEELLFVEPVTENYEDSGSMVGMEN